MSEVAQQSVLQKTAGEPLVTVVTTVFNGRRYLEDCFATLQHQTLDSWEWVVVDDGSTDDSVKVCHRLSEQPFAIRVIEPGRIGRAKALNVALSEARGRYVAVLDADDRWHHDKLRLQVNCLEQAGASFLAVSTRTLLFEKTPPIDANLGDGGGLKKKGIKDMLRFNPFCHSSIMFRYGDISYDETRRVNIDYEMYLRESRRLRKPIAVMQAKLTYKRVSPEQYFEGGDRWRYGTNGAMLAMRHALAEKQFASAAFNAFKPLYYLTPRRLALRIGALVRGRIL